MEYEQPIVTSVTCPIVIIDHQCRGQFEVDTTKIVKYRRCTSTSTSRADDNEVIDLCNDEGGPKKDVIITESAVNPRPIIVKSETDEEIQQRQRRHGDLGGNEGIASINNVLQLPPEPSFSTNSSHSVGRETHFVINYPLPVRKFATLSHYSR